MASGMPSFEQPPVVEVAIGVQFETIALTTAHLGVLWQDYREDLPNLREVPPLESVVERFGIPQQPRRPRIALVEHRTNRVWFLSETEGELVQAQADRFLYNWRTVKDPDGRAYPRFEAVDAGFFSAFDTFLSFLSRHGFGEPSITQCEITYVNHILPAAGVWGTHAEAGRAVTLVSNPEPSFLPPAEDVRASARFLIRAPDDSTAGRLYIELEPRYLVEDDTPLLLLKLTARGAPFSAGLDGVREFFAIGREWIVKGFVDVTSPEMHRVWGRR